VGGPCAGIILLTFPTPKLGGQRPERSRDSGAEKKLSRCAPCWVRTREDPSSSANYGARCRHLETPRAAPRSAGWGSERDCLAPVIDGWGLLEVLYKTHNGVPDACVGRRRAERCTYGIPPQSNAVPLSPPTTRPCCRAPFLPNKPSCGSKEDSYGALPDWREDHGGRGVVVWHGP
jgi:hypothetical protein